MTISVVVSPTPPDALVQGPEGKSAYQLAVEAGFVGSQAAWLASLHGADGQSAYQLAVEAGFVGSQAAWLASLVGAMGDDGATAYEVAVLNGFVGNEAAWLASLHGSLSPEALAASDAAVAAGAAAAGSASAASTSATAAAGSASAASTSATAAFTAAANVPGKGYATKALLDADLVPAEGIVAVVTNDPTPANNGLYRKVGASGSGSWVLASDRTSQLASETQFYRAAGDPLRSTIGAQLLIADAEGLVGTRIENGARVDIAGNLAMPLGGSLTVAGAATIDAAGGIATSALKLRGDLAGYAVAFADADGNIALAVDSAGNLKANMPASSAAAAYDTTGVYDYEVNHIFNYGQSLSVGQATPVISTVQSYDNLMFTRGMRPQYDYPAESEAQWYAALVPAVEALSPTEPILAETPSMGTGDAIKGLILAEAGMAYTQMNYQLLLSAPGWGATNISELSKGGAHFARIIAQATAAKALATAANKTYAVQAVTWTQGESDYIGSTLRATYKTKMDTLIADINTDVKAVTGQTKNIVLISYQVASHKVYGKSEPTIALAQLDAEAANPLVYIACPMYQFQYAGAGDAHLTSISSRWLGAYYGLVYKRVVIDGKDWKPLKPLSSIKQGNLLTVTFHVPKGRLVMDTDQVALNTNYGFELVDSGGATLAISSVAVTGPSTVKIVAAATIPAGAKLRYAWTGTGMSGNTAGPRGNLRDTQGDTIVFDPNGLNKPMHNWCVIFELGV